MLTWMPLLSFPRNPLLQWFPNTKGAATVPAMAESVPQCVNAPITALATTLTTVVVNGVFVVACSTWPTNTIVRGDSTASGIVWTTVCEPSVVR